MTRPVNPNPTFHPCCGALSSDPHMLTCTERTTPMPTSDAVKAAPREPTQEMIEAGGLSDGWGPGEFDEDGPTLYPAKIWRDMWDAAPTPSAMPGAADLDALADAVHRGRFKEDQEPTPFAEEDRIGREYCYRIARSVAALAQQPGASEPVDVDGLRDLDDDEPLTPEHAILTLRVWAAGDDGQQADCFREMADCFERALQQARPTGEVAIREFERGVREAAAVAHRYTDPVFGCLPTTQGKMAHTIADAILALLDQPQQENR